MYIIDDKHTFVNLSLGETAGKLRYALLITHLPTERKAQAGASGLFQKSLWVKIRDEKRARYPPQ
jgi:hypothetical protein